MQQGALRHGRKRCTRRIIGGLNEGTWPGQTANNPFIPRMMKKEIGLEPPERRIGQLAHDFELANGTRHL
ncbi:hypothetical protein ACC685_36595, partial [Rhizobium ruizarguesonis]